MKYNNKKRTGETLSHQKKKIKDGVLNPIRRKKRKGERERKKCK